MVVPMLDSTFQDIRLAVRSLRKRPLFLLVPVASLAIGVGANTAIFSAADHYLLRSPEGIPNADRVVEIGRGSEGHGFDSFSYPDFLDLREQAEPLEAVAGYEFRMLTLSEGGEGDRVFGMLVSANYFHVLGVEAERGRTFLPEEDQGLDEHPVAVLSYEYWQARLGGDPNVVGSTLLVSRKPYTVVGVLPASFQGHLTLARPMVYVPMVQYPSLSEGRNWFDSRGSSWFMVLGLLEPGATVDQADAAVSTVFQRLAEEYPETNARKTASARSYGVLPAFVRGPVMVFLATLMAFVGLLLLITCANVAGMFLARASARRKEIAIRVSMGSSRGRLLRYLLTESLVVFVLGGLGGVLLAAWGLDLLSGLELPGPFPIHLELALDGRVLVFASGVTLLTGLFFGLLPARQATELDLVGALKDEGSRARSREGRLRRGFVAAQVAASLVLLVAAGLLLRALQHAGRIERGFEAQGVYLTFLDLATEGFRAPEGSVFQDRILERFSALPWVESAALAIDLPLDLSSHGTSVRPEGWGGAQGQENLGVDFNYVSPDYFRTLQIPVEEGRGFSSMDREGSEPVAVVSREFAREVWPGQSPLGRRVLWGGSGDRWLTVVGVVSDVQNKLLTDDPKPFLYRPLAQSYDAEVHLLVRTRAPRALVVREAHQALRSLEPNLSLAPVFDLKGYTAVGLLPQRMAGILSTSLSLLALLLSGMGVYGVMAYTVSRRRREMGIRLALGAAPRRVLRSIVWGAFRMALPGLILGMILAGGVAVLLRSLLLGISPADPVALGSVTMVVTGMVLGGALIPAGRAARVDPAEALRHE